MKEATSLDFCPVLERMLAQGFIDLKDGSRVPIAGTSTLNNLKAIRYIVATQKPSKTLEIGLAYGASALTFLATHAELNSAGAQHVAIDPYQSTAWRSAALEAIAAAGLAANFRLIEQDSAFALPAMCLSGQKFGLIYIDGSHIFEDVFCDFYYCTRLLASNGWLLFDDSRDRHVNKVIRFIDKNYPDILRRESIGVAKTWMQRIGHTLGVQQLVAFRKVGDEPRPWNAKFADF